MKTITEDDVRSFNRNIAPGRRNTSTITSLVNDLNRKYGIPSDVALRVVKKDETDFATIASSMTAWLASATRHDLLRGRIEAMVSETETASDDNRWADLLSCRMRDAYLTDESAIREIFQAQETTNDISDEWWTVRIARRLATHVEAGPPLAAFIMSKAEGGGIAATTRPPGKASKIGLPGGKLDPGETAIEAATREAGEEGWQIGHVERSPFHVQDTDNYRCAWFWANGHSKMLDDYKEKGRITPIVTTYEELAAQGLGNNNAVEAIMDIREEIMADANFEPDEDDAKEWGLSREKNGNEGFTVGMSLILAVVSFVGIGNYFTNQKTPDHAIAEFSRNGADPLILVAADMDAHLSYIAKDGTVFRCSSPVEGLAHAESFAFYKACDDALGLIEAPVTPDPERVGILAEFPDGVVKDASGETICRVDRMTLLPAPDQTVGDFMKKKAVCAAFASRRA